jgi:hypothetical protein
MKLDRTTEPQFGAGPGNLAFTDVPVQPNGQQVLISRAFVVEDSMTIARAVGSVESVMAQSAANFSSGEAVAPLVSATTGLSSASSSGSLGATIVPEPTTAVVAVIGGVAATLLIRRRRLR